MVRWVLLRHELPDGSWHHDWMFEHGPRAGEGGAETCGVGGGPAGGSVAAGGLITFKLEPSVPWPLTGRFEAERLADHRREYLQYEGPVSGGRGAVQRIAAGECRVENGVERVRVWLDGREIVGRASPGGAAARRWRFRVLDGGDLEDGPDSGILHEP